MKDTLRKLALLSLSACLTFPAVAAYNPRTVTLKARSESMADDDEDFAGDIVVPENEKVTFEIKHNGSSGIYDKVEITVTKKNGSGAEVECFHHAETAVDSSAMPTFEWDTGRADPELSDGTSGPDPTPGAYTAYAKLYKDGTDPLKYTRTTTQCKVHLGPRVEILKVPEFLFANAKNATTIQWKVEGVQNDFAQSEDLSKVSIGFYTDASNEVFNKDFTERTVGVNDDGTLSSLSDYTGTTFETYIGADEYAGIDLDNDRTRENTAYFFVTTHWDGDYTYSLESENEPVRYFIDSDVPAVDIPGTKDIGPKREFPESAMFFGRAKRQSTMLEPSVLKSSESALSDCLWIFEPYGYNAEGSDEISWPYGTPSSIPSYRFRVWYTGDQTREENGPLFDYVFMGSQRFGSIYDCDIKSSTHVTLLRNSVDELATYNPTLLMKNLGTRYGAGIYFSYGPRNNIPAGVLGPNEKAMSYARKNATVELYLFKGNVNIDIQVRGDDYFQQSVGDAGSILFSLFCKYVPYTDILENTVEIFDAINQFTTNAAITSAGQGAFRAHYKRISINGEDDDGQLEEVRVPGNNSLHSGTFEKEVDIQKDPINVDVGDYAAIYVDASTIFQQCSEGYWDFWGISKPPDLHAEVFFERFTKGDAEPYFHVYRR